VVRDDLRLEAGDERGKDLEVSLVERVDGPTDPRFRETPWNAIG
jgi:hypothetical protein